ncbi:hypothetical protein B0H14DRAFT_3735852 [Mycena olivaceomarginata]|nr:hypothetical protein B0H14DRAFT_3735852 [Mycena olivaceomarginata]
MTGTTPAHVHPHQPPFPPPPHRTPLRIIKNADQPASIFLHQELKIAGCKERARTVDAIFARGFSNGVVQRCPEAATGPQERRNIVAYMFGRIVDVVMNCNGHHVHQNLKALDCEEEVCLLIVSELFRGDPTTLVNKHTSRSSPGPHWRLTGVLEFAMNGQGTNTILNEGGKETLDHVMQHMCESAKGYVLLPSFLSFSRLALPVVVVDVALSLVGSQLIASVLPMGDKDQRAALYDCIYGHIVTLHGCKTGSKVIWFFASSSRATAGARNTGSKLLFGHVASLA